MSICSYSQCFENAFEKDLPSHRPSLLLPVPQVAVRASVAYTPSANRAVGLHLEPSPR